ncbi:MAG TPA: hypothetical protein PLF40_01415 [Kofleriaceae bacterium]|nr:hypothetical protein [Kofleriaceae bacterium]
MKAILSLGAVSLFFTGCFVAAQPAAAPTTVTAPAADPNAAAIVLSCNEGSCNQVCPTGASCTFDCNGGSCNQACDTGSTCAMSCNGGSCGQACSEGATCTVDCNGGSCH